MVEAVKCVLLFLICLPFPFSVFPEVSPPEDTTLYCSSALFDLTVTSQLMELHYELNTVSKHIQLEAFQVKRKQYSVEADFEGIL